MTSFPPPPPNPTLKGHKLLVVSALPITPENREELKKRFPDLAVDYVQASWGGENTTEDPFSPELWRDVTVLVTMTQLPTRDLARKLQYVQFSSAGIGFALKHPLYKEEDIVFCAGNGIHGPQIAEWVISTYLAFEHYIPQYLEYQKQAKWQRIDDLVNDSPGRRVGILGYGAIGRQVARVSRALGMDVHAYTNHPRPTPESRRDTTYAPEGTGDPEGIFPSKWYSGSSTEDLHAFLDSGLDLLVVSTPLTEKTQGLIGKAEFEILGKKKTFVSNIARGPIIQTDALIEALENDVIRGAALDVTDPEPLPDGHKLWTTKNVIITPHISGSTKAYGQRVFEILTINLGLLSEGKELINQVSRKDGY